MYVLCDHSQPQATRARTAEWSRAERTAALTGAVKPQYAEQSARRGTACVQPWGCRDRQPTAAQVSIVTSGSCPVTVGNTQRHCGQRPADLRSPVGRIKLGGLASSDGVHVHMPRQHILHRRTVRQQHGVADLLRRTCVQAHPHTHVRAHSRSHNIRAGESMDSAQTADMV